MKRSFGAGAICALVVGVLLLAGCGRQSGRGAFGGKTLNLYVAAGLKKPMDQVIQSFQQETGATVAVNYGPSGGLYAQIMQDQPCDLYYSADWIYIEKVEQAGKLEKAGKFLNDNLVLVVSETGQNEVAGMDDLVKPKVSFTIADSASPCGVYSKRALISIGLWDRVHPNIKAMPSTVNQVAILVKEDQVDAGLVYSSVARGNELKQVAVIDETHTGEIIFGYAIIKGGQNKMAEAFAAHAAKHVKVFEQYGWKACE